MSQPRHQTPYPCPACETPTWACDDTDEGRLLEYEDECRHCRLWGSEYAYGGHTERIGFARFDWSYSDEDDFEADRKAARLELFEVYHHPEFAAMYSEAPRWAMADWFGDRGFPIQEASLRAMLATGEYPAHH